MSRMLAGLISRCTTPSAWAQDNASSTCSMIETASALGEPMPRPSACARRPLPRIPAQERVRRIHRSRRCDDVGVVAAAGGLRFPPEAGEVGGLLLALQQVGADQLDRHGAIDLGVVRLVDHAHRAASQHPLDLVAADVFGCAAHRIPRIMPRSFFFAPWGARMVNWSAPACALRSPGCAACG